MGGKAERDEGSLDGDADVGRRAVWSEDAREGRTSSWIVFGRQYDVSRSNLRSSWFPSSHQSRFCSSLLLLRTVYLTLACSSSLPFCLSSNTKECSNFPSNFPSSTLLLSSFLLQPTHSHIHLQHERFPATPRSSLRIPSSRVRLSRSLPHSSSFSSQHLQAILNSMAGRSLVRHGEHSRQPILEVLFTKLISVDVRFTVRYVPARMGTYLVGQVDAYQDLLPYQVSTSTHFLPFPSRVTESSFDGSRWSSLVIQVLLLVFRFAELSNGESILRRFSCKIRRLNFSIFEQKLALAFTSSTLLAGSSSRCEFFDPIIPGHRPVTDHSLLDELFCG